MKKLFQDFIELPSLEGIFLIVAAGVFVLIIALVVSRISFRAGVRYSEARHVQFASKRRELASIRQ